MDIGMKAAPEGAPHISAIDRMRPGMKYTCTEYREEMLLLALRKQLSRNGLSDEEKRRISEEIRKLEAKMDMA